MRCAVMWRYWSLLDQSRGSPPPDMRSGPHTIGTEFIRHVIEESIRVRYAHAKVHATLLKARLGPRSTMAWVLQELRLHQQAERDGVQRELLEC